MSFFVEFSKFREVFEDDFKRIRISRNSYGTPYDFIKKHQNVWKNHMVPPMILQKSIKMFEKSYGPPYDFLRITKILKKSYGTPYDFLRIVKILKKSYDSFPLWFLTKLSNNITFSYGTL